MFVNRDNPVETLTIEQVDAVFSKTNKCGLTGSVRTWGDLGATGAWARRPISLYGRNSASGTYGYFKKHALCKGDYRDEVKEQPGSASVVQGITEDRFGIGYSGIGYRTSGVKAVRLAKTKGAEAYSTDLTDVMSGQYPLSRFLYVYVNKAPGKPVAPNVREFIRYVLSREGQEAVVRDGYLPVTADVANRQLAKLQ